MVSILSHGVNIYICYYLLFFVYNIYFVVFPDDRVVAEVMLWVEALPVPQQLTHCIPGALSPRVK
jgi:hypothetical protein